ncbi:nitrile hydratase accessory protein [Rhodovulum sp. DZ06]|uniref:nitrile hydratase accessory protein n=1 Tax=Rhodovulum sp. DZ06 TaxID=3425126 RepID=UPI003D355979
MSASADAAAAADPFAPGRFEEPWHAQVFALTVALSEAGRFAWPEWAEAFGATLARNGAAQGPLDGGEDYFMAWLETLEALLEEKGAAEAKELRAMKAAWAAAYAATPHGEPVKLSR